MKKYKIAIMSPIVNTRNDIYSFTTNVAFNILNELKKYEDIEIVKYIKSGSYEAKNIYNADLNGAEHVLSLVLRQWSYFNNEDIQKLKSKIRGKLFQYYDSGSRRELTDINFTLLEQGMSKNDVYMGWSADPNIFNINKCKDDEELYILIDHPHFSTKDPSLDMSDSIANDCYKLINNRKLLKEFNKNNNTSFKKVKVKRLVSGGIEDLDINKKINNDYSHSSVSQKDLAQEYAKAHIFIPTHKESMGLCILEAAMSGCFIISPKDFIKQTCLDKVNYYKFINNIDWLEIKNSINPIENRNKVLKWDWQRSVKIIYNTIKKYSNYDN